MGDGAMDLDLDVDDDSMHTKREVHHSIGKSKGSCGRHSLAYGAELDSVLVSLQSLVSRTQ